MESLDFLRHVLPTTGPYCICIDRPNGFIQLPAADLDEAVAIAHEQDKNNENVFFAVGALKKARTWDEKQQRVRTIRTGENIRGLRAYTADIDAGNGRAYETTADAITALRAFCNTHKLPKPTIVQSGFGLHVYWPVSEEVPQAEWEAHGTVLVSMAHAAGLKIDSGRTKDSSSVLRVVGTHNQKYPDRPEVQVLLEGATTPTAAFHALLSMQTVTPIAALAGAPPPVSFGNNTNRYEYESLDPHKLHANCQVFRDIVNPANQRRGREAVTEPMWMGAIMLAVHCKNGRKVAHSISDQDPRYDKQYVEEMFNRFTTKGIGPTTCTKFQEAYKDFGDTYACRGCPSFGKITSPAVVARYVKELPAPLVQEVQDDGTVEERLAPDLPEYYIRTKNGIGLKFDNPKTGAPDVDIFCPADIYPLPLRYDEKTNLSRGQWWSIKPPNRERFEAEIPYCSANQLRVTLAEHHIIVQEVNVPNMNRFMTSYVQKLQNEQPPEKTYSKFGWRSEGGFILGDMWYKRNGDADIAHPSKSIEHIAEGIVMGGDFDIWKRAISIYARPGLEIFRCYLYSTFASPLYHMTGEVATCVNACGVGGVGKTTLMEACASIWGDPTCMMAKGGDEGMTRAAAEAMADAMNHLPLFLDEIGDREARSLADMIKGYSGGKGKMRSQPRGGVRADTATWSNIAMVNANTDGYAVMSSIYHESSPHMMRLIQLEFEESHIVSKEEGSEIKRLVHENYGMAGHVYAEYLAQYQSEIKLKVRTYLADIDRQVKAESRERYWTAWVASCKAGAEIASRLNLLPGFPVDDDVQFMCKYMDVLRAQTYTHQVAAADTLALFIHEETSRTLRLKAKNSGNIDDVAGEPHGGFTIRHELDNAVMYVSRDALQTYYVQRKIDLNRHLKELVREGIVIDANMKKVLGAGTSFAKGQVRCLMVDMNMLEPKDPT